MWILPLVGYLGMALGFVFVTLAIASGLYYLAELVEEHTVLAKKLITRLIYFVICTQLLLTLVDGFPFLLSLLGIVSHLVYLGNMRRFPVVRLSDPMFIAACALVIIDHYFWFRHFSNLAPPMPRSRFDKVDYPSFTEIASYFGLCVWLVPFVLFVSLSASDNVLPTMSSEAPAGLGGSNVDKKNRRAGMAKAVVDNVKGMVTQAGDALGWWKAPRDPDF